MEPVGSLPHSQVPATCPYPDHFSISCVLPKDQSISEARFECFLTRYVFTVEQQDHPLSAVRNCLCQCYQPPGRGPVPGPGINYTGPREVLLEFVILIFLNIFR